MNRSPIHIPELQILFSKMHYLEVSNSNNVRETREIRLTGQFQIHSALLSGSDHSFTKTLIFQSRILIIKFNPKIIKFSPKFLWPHGLVDSTLDCGKVEWKYKPVPRNSFFYFTFDARHAYNELYYICMYIHM